MTSDKAPALADLEAHAKALGNAIGTACPPNVGFTLLLYTIGEAGWLTYISNSKREDMLRTMIEFISKHLIQEGISMMEDAAVGTVLKPVLIASICHEANAQYCKCNGDYSQPSWEHAPEWQRESALAGVQAILDGTITEPSQSHESWMAQKKLDGWVYGAEKDTEKKTHPCMVPYNELPAEQRRKDHLFFAIVKALTEPIS